MTPRGACVNEFALISNDYNAIHARLTRTIERNPQEVLKRLLEGLKRNWDKFNAHCDSKTEFDWDKLQLFRQDLAVRIKKANEIIDKYWKPNPNQPVPTFVDVYAPPKPKRKRKTKTT